MPPKTTRITFGILTVSDSCFYHNAKDVSGPKLVECVRESIPNADITYTGLVPDEIPQITTVLRKLIDARINVVLTTGGTGFSPRDLTPQATKMVIQREAPGICHAMMAGSLGVTPMAMLSNAVCGTAEKTLIINLPGSFKAATECFGFIKGALPHAVDVLTDVLDEVQKVHTSMQSSLVKLPTAASRIRISPFPMIEVCDALKLVESEMKDAAGTEVVDITEVLHRVALEDVYSREPLPPFPASMKDGYAAISSDTSRTRKVRLTIAAGDEPTQPSLGVLAKGEVARINTGAPVPPGADAIIQVEDTEVAEATLLGEEISITIKAFPNLGQDIRPIGTDIPANTLLFSKGEVITPGHIGVMASVGTTTIKTSRKFTVGIISTGNELLDPKEPSKPGHVRDSNKLALIALLKQQNFTAEDCGNAKDTPDDVMAKISNALIRHDVIVTTGGVSMGEFDVVKEVLLKDFNATIHFGRVNMKPGKPTTFATCTYQGIRKFFFALPGNPVSAMVTATLFVIPGLRMSEGFPQPPKMMIRLDETLTLDPRPEYMRARVNNVDGQLVAQTTGSQISSRMVSFLGAQVLLVLPQKSEGLKVLEAGVIVEAIKIYQVTL